MRTQTDPDWKSIITFSVCKLCVLKYWLQLIVLQMKYLERMNHQVKNFFVSLFILADYVNWDEDWIVSKQSSELHLSHFKLTSTGWHVITLTNLYCSFVAISLEYIKRRRLTLFNISEYKKSKYCCLSTCPTWANSYKISIERNEYLILLWAQAGSLAGQRMLTGYLLVSWQLIN